MEKILITGIIIIGIILVVESFVFSQIGFIKLIRKIWKE